jgi:hypothetical protein
MPLIGQGDATPHGGYRFASVHCCTEPDPLPSPLDAGEQEPVCCLVGHIFVMGIGRGRSQVSVFQKAMGGFSFPVVDIDSDWSTIWKGFWGTIGDLIDKAEEAGDVLKAAQERPPPNEASNQELRKLANALSSAIDAVLAEINRISGGGGEWSNPDTGGGREPAATERLFERLRGLHVLMGGSNGDGTAGDPGGAPRTPGFQDKPPFGNVPLGPIIMGPGLTTTGTITLKGRSCGPATVNWELIGARPSRTITSPYGQGYTFPAKPGRLKLTGSCRTGTLKFAILGDKGRAISGPWNQDPRTRGLAGDLISMFGGDLDPGILPTGAELTTL